MSTNTLSLLEPILQDRGKAYGNYVSMASVAQQLKRSLRDHSGWHKLDDYQKESLDLIMTKIARIIVGNPNNPDSWLDIQGYAKIAHDHLPAAPAMPEDWSEPATP